MKFHGRLLCVTGCFDSAPVDRRAAIRQIGFTRLRLASILLDAKFFDIRIKHKLFTRDQRNVQETTVTFKSLPRNTLNEGMTFEQSGPNYRKTISPAYQLGAPAREIASFLLRHFRLPIGS